MQIYLARPGGQKEGPFTLEQINRDLAGGKYTANDYWAWHDGMASWTPLHALPGINITPVPPVASKPAAAPPPKPAPAPTPAAAEPAPPTVVHKPAPSPAAVAATPAPAPVARVETPKPIQDQPPTAAKLVPPKREPVQSAPVT